MWDYTERVETPNDPKLSDGGAWRGTCMAGGKAAAEAGAVTHGAVRGMKEEASVILIGERVALAQNEFQ